MNVLIKNKVGSGVDKLSGGQSWIQAYAERHELPEACPVCGDGEQSKLQGAHVVCPQKGAGTYITPLCPLCNNPGNTAEMSIDESWLLPEDELWLDSLPEGEWVSFEA